MVTDRSTRGPTRVALDIDALKDCVARGDVRLGMYVLGNVEDTSGIRDLAIELLQAAAKSRRAQMVSWAIGLVRRH